MKFSNRNKSTQLQSFQTPEPVEPSCLTKALKIPKWKAAMLDEFTTILANGTWTLVPKQNHFNIIGSKWVYHIKRNTNGSIARYKVRLVAKWFHQRPGINYIDTFIQSSSHM